MTSLSDRLRFPFSISLTPWRVPFIHWAVPRTTAGGLEIFQDDQGLGFHAIRLTRKKDEVHIESTLSGSRDFDKITSFLGKDIQVNLVLNTREVLFKTTSLPLQDPGWFVKLLPQAKVDDFYHRRTDLETGGLVSLVRQSALHQHLASCQEAGLFITAMELGVCCVQSLAPFLPSPEGRIPTTRFTIYLSREGKLQSFQEEINPAEELTMGGDPVTSHLLPAYAGAFRLLTGQTSPSDTVPLLTRAAREYKYKTLYENGSRYFIRLMLVSLLLHGSFYRYYQVQNRKYEEKRDLFHSRFSEIKMKQEQIAEKRLFLSNTRLNLPSQASFYADRICASLPPGMRLTEMVIFPLKTDRGKKPEFEDRQILVKGKCTSGSIYSKWLGDLERLHWLTDVQSISYQDLDLGKSTFEVRIMIPDGKD